MKSLKTLRTFLYLAAIAICLSISAIAQTSKIADQIAAVTSDSTEVRWNPQIDYARLVLTVSTPDGEVFRKEFEAGAAPSFKLTDEKGVSLPDGQYIYELRLVPNLRRDVKKALAASREKGDSDQVERSLRKDGLLPSQEIVQSGSFAVVRGSVVKGDPENDVEPQSINRSAQPGVAPESRGGKKGEGAIVPLDQVIPDDLIVQGSACVGLDCVNNESFGFDTIRLKENNTRIKFDDTSVTAGFPSNDWQLTANDSASGGASKFSIDDVSGSKTPFTVLAGAPTNAVFVDGSGRLGLGTSTPVLDIHKVTGNTPALRLDQNGSSGFTPQVWDIAGNEANFFIRDVTGGSRLPFRIRPGAPTSSIDIATDGKVGVGTSAPNSNVHVLQNADSFTLIRVQNSNATVNAQAGVAVQSDTGAADYKAHASVRTLSRWGVTLGGWVEFLGTGGNGLAVGTQIATPLILGTNSADVIHITPAGNVGIGTATPGGKLDVNGSIFQRGGQIHADYVFDPNYKLESIEEHATFMWNNKHLPAVPGKTVDAEGREVVEIGARSRGVLEELEKAHIYIEQLNQKITQKDEQLTRLERQNAELAERLARIEALVSGAKTDKK